MEKLKGGHTISILVEQAKRLLELSDLVVCELIRHFLSLKNPIRSNTSS